MVCSRPRGTYARYALPSLPLSLPPSLPPSFPPFFPNHRRWASQDRDGFAQGTSFPPFLPPSLPSSLPHVNKCQLFSSSFLYRRRLNATERPPRDNSIPPSLPPSFRPPILPRMLNPPLCLFPTAPHHRRVNASGRRRKTQRPPRGNLKRSWSCKRGIT